MLRKAIVFLVSFCFIAEQACYSWPGATDISGQLALSQPTAQPCPAPCRLRSVAVSPDSGEARFFLDKGNEQEVSARLLDELRGYFLIGLSLPDNTFWVNLRPDSKDRMLDPALAKTDMGRVMLCADLQLKKDTAGYTSPQTPTGKEYWEKLYKKAGELFGTTDVIIPTLTRPWIVPGEILLRETRGKVYIYKARLKVMLEADYLKETPSYSFADARQKELNDYSTSLIRESIIPKITKEINSSPKYAQLRQVYYSLILAQWYKKRFRGQPGKYPAMIDAGQLEGLTSRSSWSPEEYFIAYQKSFKDGEYNLKEDVRTASGESQRTYLSGGLSIIDCQIPPAPAQGRTVTAGETTVIGGDEAKFLPGTVTGHNPEDGGAVVVPVSGLKQAIEKLAQEGQLAGAWLFVDIDDTLFYQAWNYSAQNFVPMLSRIVKNAQAVTGASDEAVSAAILERWKRMEDARREANVLRVVDGVNELFRFAKDNGMRLRIITNRPEAMRAKTLEVMVGLPIDISLVEGGAQGIIFNGFGNGKAHGILTSTNGSQPKKVFLVDNNRVNSETFAKHMAGTGIDATALWLTEEERNQLTKDDSYKHYIDQFASLVAAPAAAGKEKISLSLAEIALVSAVLKAAEMDNGARQERLAEIRHIIDSAEFRRFTENNGTTPQEYLRASFLNDYLDDLEMSLKKKGEDGGLEERSAFRVSELKSMLADRLFRPDTVKLFQMVRDGLSEEEVLRACSEAGFDLRSVPTELTRLELEGLRPFLYRLVQALFKGYPDHTILMAGRDTELLYDAYVAAAQLSSVQKNNVELFPGSLLFWMQFRDENTPGERLRFFSQYGITADSLVAGPRWLIVDTGFFGSIGQRVHQHLAELFDQRLDDLRKSIIPIKLISHCEQSYAGILAHLECVEPEGPGMLEAVKSFFSGEQEDVTGMLKETFPLSRRSWSTYGRAYDEGEANYPVAVAMQTMPKFHGPYASLKEENGRLYAVPKAGAEIEQDIEQRYAVNQDVVNPGFALLIQYWLCGGVLEDFNSGKLQEAVGKEWFPGKGPDGGEAFHPEVLSWVRSNGFLDSSKPLTEEGIKLINRYVTEKGYTIDSWHEYQGREGLAFAYDRGEYRRVSMYLKASDPEDIQGEMKRFVEWLKTGEQKLGGRSAEEFAAEAFIRFIEIHPFSDGNGRTGRLLLNILLLRHQRAAIDYGLIEWTPALTGFKDHLPQDAQFLASLIRQAQKGESTKGYTRYGPKGVRGKVPDLQVLLAAKHVSGGDFLNWLRDLVGWSLPGVEIMDTIYSKTTLTAWEMEEFMMTLDLCRKKANHPSTIADIKDLINHFSVLTNIRPDGGLPGGIDFRALPLKDCSVDPAALFNGVPASAVNMDIDAEWKSIESLVNRGILPSCRRVTELTAACYAKGALANRSENLLECLSSILRLEEERDQPTESVLRDILVLLEAA